ncbi:hypothetical protein TrLO_g8584 [Triparma laevis f. longispina]|uniref:Uncharacterized protein n=1 Tax=Triparma laevis f. longispina TaxID=1714387 RepID=A0A9W7EAQ2_9STRA|nr:hypothetical protein TrLO_g8584 [Triparma laevis f. longispina]
MKLCKDAKILDSHLTRTNVDLIFTKVKSKGTTKLSYDQFIQALHMFAEKKRQSQTKIMLAIAAIRGPTVSGTVADPNRFHDDKSTYTGVHTKGGPTKIDNMNNISLSNLMDRSQNTDVRGVKKGTTDRRIKPTQRKLVPGDIGLQAEHELAAEEQMRQMQLQADARHGGDIPPPGPPPPAGGRQDPYDIPPPGPPPLPGNTPFGAMLSGSSAQEASHLTTSSLEDHLYTNFCSFCDTKGGEPKLHSAGFLKFCKDMKIVGKGFTSTDVDLIFQKSKSGGNYAKTISYKEFRQVAIPLTAQRRKVTEQALLERCSKVKGKVLHGTVAEANRFHDDKSTYTGVYKAGGPTHNDNAITLEMLADRSNPGSIRGVPNAPPGGYTHGESGIGSLQNQPRQGHEVIHETPMYSQGANVLPPTPQESKRPTRTSVHLKNMQAQQGPPHPSVPPPGSGQKRFSLNRTRPQGAKELQAQGLTIAGEANKQGGVYDRLSNQKTYTGVYAKRFSGSGGRINGDTINGRSYNGDTNQGTDVRVDDISQILRR